VMDCGLDAGATDAGLVEAAGVLYFFHWGLPR
jgi:hypothetical protein